MKTVITSVAAVCAIIAAITSKASPFQDGWYIATNMEPVASDWVHTYCQDLLPPACAFFYLNGNIVETLNSPNTEM